MSNYPDDFKGTNMDARPEEEFPVEVAQIEKAQQAYKQIVESTIHILRKHGLTHYGRAAYTSRKGPAMEYVEAIDRLSFLGLADFLRHSVDAEIKDLEGAGYDYSVEGDDTAKFFDKMYALLKSEAA